MRGRGKASAVFASPCRCASPSLRRLLSPVGMVLASPCELLWMSWAYPCLLQALCRQRPKRSGSHVLSCQHSRMTWIGSPCTRRLQRSLEYARRLQPDQTLPLGSVRSRERFSCRRWRLFSRLSRRPRHLLPCSKPYVSVFMCSNHLAEMSVVRCCSQAIMRLSWKAV